MQVKKCIILEILVRNSDKAPKPFLSKYFDIWLESLENLKSFSPETLRAYSSDFLQLADYIEKNKRSQKLENLDLNCQLLIDVGKKIWSDLAISTRQRKFSTLKSFLRFLFEEGHLVHDLSTTITLPKVDEKLPRYLSLDEVLAVLNYFKKAFKDQPKSDILIRKRRLFLLLYGGGLRVSEACHSQWKDVILEKSKLRILGKGSKERYISLPSILTEELKTSNKKTGYLLNPKLSERQAYTLIRSCGTQAGLLRPLSPHALRHSYATHLLRGGADLRTIQDLLGHSSLKTTEKYTHLDFDSLRTTLEKHHPLSLKERSKI